MIISASRRTDIPAFYTKWFINRIRAGYCLVSNPYRPQQVSRVSLLSRDVDVIVFWTRNPRPLFPHLQELTDRGYHFYFQYTLLSNPRSLDPKSPSIDKAIETFHELAGYIGKQRIIWRYDPIVLSEITPPSFHLDVYQHLAHSLQDITMRSVISFMKSYHKISSRIKHLEQKGIRLLPFDGTEQWFSDLMSGFSKTAGECRMQIQSCAEELELSEYGIYPGKCVDDGYIADVFGLDVTHTKDPGQRKACGCVISKDIGAYDTCLFGCQYCYATSSFARASRNNARHNPNAVSLLGQLDENAL